MEDVRRTYSMSNVDLCMLASNLIMNMTRDATQFAVRGVDSTAITAFETLGNAFEIFPPDEVYVGDIKDATAEKNVLRESLTIQVQKISGFVEQMWGRNSGKYSALKIVNLQRMSDAAFVFSCRNVVERATVYLTALSSIGLTQSMIDTLETDSQSFEDKLNEITNYKEIRDTKAKERTDKGNELYSYVTMYCKIGKLIWENVDSAKYNDYIIYPTIYSGLSKPQNLAAVYDPLNPPNIILSWDAVTEATSYDVYVSIKDTGSPAGDFSFLNNFSTSPAAIPSIIDKRNYFKIKAKNDSATSIYSDEVFVDVPVA